MPFKLGCNPREFRPQVPHFSSLLRLKPIQRPTPQAVDYTRGMPVNLGMMANDEIGNCTAAAFYHARQVWTFNTKNIEKTEPDSDIIELYSESTGYKPSDPNSDQGGTCQQVLTYLHKSGAPLGDKGQYRDKILSFVEIDPRNLADIKLAIWQTGLVYIGFRVPEFLMANDEPPLLWRLSNHGTDIIGGHCVVLPGFTNDHYLTVISWGKRYLMSESFFERYVDEVYAIVDINWIQGTGKTLLGLTIPELEKQMWAL